MPATASAVPGVTATDIVYRSQFEFQNSLATLTAVSTQHLADTLILRMTAGSPAALGQNELLIDSTTATSKHLSAGDTVRRGSRRRVHPPCASAGYTRRMP